MDSSSVIALVPMRHRSVRVPGKNYRPLAGKPLYAHILETLRSVPEVSQIVVNTDSPTIAGGLKSDFPDVILIERPEHLRGEGIPMNDVLKHDLRQIDGDLFLQTHSTNPLLKAETITRAIETFLENEAQHDSLFSVTRVQTRFWTPGGDPINHEPSRLLRTQDLPPYMEENSCLYVFRRRVFFQDGKRIGQRPYLFELPALQAVDIDEERDFLMAECLLKSEAYNENDSPED